MHCTIRAGKWTCIVCVIFGILHQFFESSTGKKLLCILLLTFFFWCNFQILWFSIDFCLRIRRRIGAHTFNTVPIEWKIQWLFGKCVRHTMNTIQLLLGIFNPLYNLNGYFLRFIFSISFCHCGWVTQVKLYGCHI